MEPVSRSIASTASVVGCCGSEYPLPVDTYSTRRRASIVGADQMPPPEGPQACTPSLVTPRFLGSSAIVYVFQIWLPVLASSAVTLPRKVQHSYVARPPCPSSLRPASGT